MFPKLCLNVIVQWLFRAKNPNCSSTQTVPYNHKWWSLCSSKNFMFITWQNFIPIFYWGSGFVWEACPKFVKGPSSDFETPWRRSKKNPYSWPHFFPTAPQFLNWMENLIRFRHTTLRPCIWTNFHLPFTVKGRWSLVKGTLSTRYWNKVKLTIGFKIPVNTVRS